jgi:hypothetical protein
MKKIVCLSIIATLAFAGRFGLGITGGGEYKENYETITVENIHNLFYGAEFYIQAEALPSIFLRPTISYLHNPSISSSMAGVGIGVNVQPRLGNFPIAPFFGVTGTILLHNDLDVTEAVRTGRLNEYIETSTPQLVGSGYAGINLFLGRNLALDCNYRYHSFSPQFGVEMVWAGLSYNINW